MNTSSIHGISVSYLDWSLKGKTAPWRYLLATFLALLIWVFGAVPEMMLLGAAIDISKVQSTTLLYSFLPGLIGLLLIPHYILGRPSYSLFAASWPPAWRDYMIGGGIVVLVSVMLFFALMPFFKTDFQGLGPLRQFGYGMVVITLVGFVIQTAFEELMYRGLLMQFARRLTSRVPLIILPQALLFAIPHFGNVSSWSAAGLLSVTPYIIVALAWGWVAWRTGSVMMTMGFHFANNSTNMFLWGARGDIVASYAPFVQDMPSLPIVTIIACVNALVSAGIVEWIMRRREKPA